MTTDLHQCALVQVQWLRVEDLQDDVAGVAVNRLPPLHLRWGVCQEGVCCKVQLGQVGATKAIALRAGSGQHKDDVVVGCVHAVEVSKVEAGSGGVQQLRCGDLETQRAVGGISGGQAGVELRVTAEKDSTQRAIDRRAVTTAAVFEGGVHHPRTR